MPIDKKISSLKKGDIITIKFASSFSNGKVTLKVRSRNKVRKGKIDKITFENVNNPNTVKYYAYERGSGKWGFAKGDMAISKVNIVPNDKNKDKASLTKKVGTKVYRYSAIVKTKEIAEKYINKNKGVDILGINRQYKAYKINNGYIIYMHSSKKLRK